jgi:hypothetical protein
MSIVMRMLKTELGQRVVRKEQLKRQLQLPSDALPNTKLPPVFFSHIPGHILVLLTVPCTSAWPAGHIRPEITCNQAREIPSSFVTSYLHTPLLYSFQRTCKLPLKTCRSFPSKKYQDTLSQEKVQNNM